MKKKVLFVATVDSHIRAFHLPYLELFKSKGYEVHVVTNGSEVFPFCDYKHTISIERSPFSINNIKAIKSLKKIIDQECFSIIHCHTPMGSVVTRLAAKKSRRVNNTKVIYTAHGFHFHKNAPLINWVLYYPIEKMLSRYTDELITINKEDYELAKFRFKVKVNYVPGVGINYNKFNFLFSDKEKNNLRKSLGLGNFDKVIIQVGELNDNKNQISSIKVMSELVKIDKSFKLLIVGTGVNEVYLKNLVKDLGLLDNIIFLGYRFDVNKLLKISDLLISTSKREGLPVNIIEALVSGKPVVTMNCRGARDLIVEGENGYVVEIDDIDEMIEKIKICFDKEFNNFYYEDYLLDKVISAVDLIYEGEVYEEVN